jgi:hypothetical protein
MKDNTLDDVWVTKPSNVVPFSRRMVGEFSITITVWQENEDYFSEKPTNWSVLPK